LGALNLPSAADIERVTRRLRSLSQRLEGIEDSIDRLEERLAMVAASAGHDDRLSRIEGRLDEISRDVNGLRESVSPSGDPVPRAQERLTVTDS
jgi:archaellum component FlaC